jgi:hypothetical protein
MDRTLIPFLVCAVLGVMLLALGGMAFMNAARWADLARDGAMVGWSVVGVFLTAAGIAALAGGWNHSFRVLRGAPPRHHH